MPPRVDPKGAPQVCTDLTDVDLSVFKQLPHPKELSDIHKADAQVQGFYKEIEIFQLIDDQFGIKDGILQAAEIDKFLKANPSNDPKANACEILKAARQFVDSLPEILSELKKGPDLTPVDLASFYSLPELKKLVDLPDSQDEEVFKAQVNASNLSPELKKLLIENEEILARYANAKGYIKADVDGDGTLSPDDITQLIKKNNLPTNDPSLSPAVILLEARQNAAQAVLFSSGLRKQFGLKNDANHIPLMSILAIGQVAPKFLESHPELNTLLQAIAKKKDKNQYELIPTAEDLVLTKEELLNSPALAAHKKENARYTTDEAFFKSLQNLVDALENPIFLWPKDLREKLKSEGTEAMTYLSQMQAITDDQRRAELILGFLDKVDDGKIEQEKMDHAGSEGTFLSDVTYVLTFGQWSWNRHFQEERPKSHQAEREDAIEALRATMRDRHLGKVEDAVSAMLSNGMGDKVDALKKYCDLEWWIKVGNTEDQKERAELLQSAAKKYRLGEYKFWEFPIIPLPRLGEGGFFERASDFDNWTFKSPELPVTLSIDNFLATKTPNNWDLTHKGGSPYLFAQLSQVDQKVFTELGEKAQKGETIDARAMEAIISKSSLTTEGKETLKALLKSSITDMENAKVVKDFSQTAFLQDLRKDEEKNKEKLARIDGLFGAVAGGLATADKLGGDIAQLFLGEEDAKILKEYLGKVQANLPIQEPKGVEVLFREAQLGDKLARAKELFEKSIQTPEEKKEFNDLVTASKLSGDNKKVLSLAYDKQPMTISIADPAEKEFLAILGFPEQDSMTGNYKPKSVGNLHNTLSATAGRGIGGGMFLGPMIVGGGIGHSLVKAGQSGGLPKAGLFGAVGGGFAGYALSDGESTGTRIAYTAIGAGLGAGLFYGTARFAKGFNPWYAAVAGSMLGSMIYISPGGQKWASQSWEVMQMPYRPWSDLAMMNAPAEGLALYMDFYGGSKAMEGILGGAKMVGAMELGDKLAKLLRVTPAVVKTGTGAALGSGMGYLTSDKKEGNQVRNTIIGGILGTTLSFKTKWPFGAALGGTIGYAGSDHKDWKTDVRRTMTGAFIGGTAFYWGGKLFKNVNFKGYTSKEAETAGEWVKKQINLLDTEIARQRAGLNLGKGPHSPFRFSPVTVAEREASIARLEALSKAYKILGEANNSVSLQILTNSEKNFSRAEKLMTGFVPEGLTAAEMKLLDEIGAKALGKAKLAQTHSMLLAGAQEVDITNRMLISNGRLSRLLLTGVVANRIDEKIKPKPPLIPPFSKDFQGNPRPKPQKSGGKL